MFCFIYHFSLSFKCVAGNHLKGAISGFFNKIIKQEAQDGLIRLYWFRSILKMQCMFFFTILRKVNVRLLNVFKRRQIPLLVLEKLFKVFHINCSSNDWTDLIWMKLIKVNTRMLQLGTNVHTGGCVCVLHTRPMTLCSRSWSHLEIKYQKLVIYTI